MIQLQFRHLLYDIEQQTYAITTARGSESHEAKDEAQIDGTRHLSDLSLRYCEEGCAKLKVLIKGKLSADQPVQPTIPEFPTDPSTDELADTVAWNFSLTEEKPDAHTLTTLFHQFVVAYALTQWSKAHAPNDVQGFIAQQEQAKQQIKKAIYELGTPRKHRTPPIQMLEPEITIIQD